MTNRLHRTGHETHEIETPWEGDKLGREEVAKKLTQMVSTIRSSFVISLEGSYGEGKTFFLKNWQKDLENQGYITAYFNAWENDTQDDPLIPFVAALETAVQHHRARHRKDPNSSRPAEFLSFTKSFGIKVGGIGLKAITRKMLGDEGVEDLKDLLDNRSEEDIAKLIGDSLEGAVKKDIEAQEAMRGFRTGLSDTIRDITEGEDDDNKRKIIVLVDELDRCRPDFAVTVLERIKHFFEVEGLVFILGINEAQIVNSMKQIYGPNLDADAYLKRFIHWRVRLPRPNNADYGFSLAEKFQLEECLPANVKRGNGVSLGDDSIEAMVSVFGFMADRLGLSLRQQEQAFTVINLILRMSSERGLYHSALLGLIVPIWMVKKVKPIDASANWETLFLEACFEGGQTFDEHAYQRFLSALGLGDEDLLKHYNIEGLGWSMPRLLVAYKVGFNVVIDTLDDDIKPNWESYRRQGALSGRYTDEESLAMSMWRRLDEMEQLLIDQ